MERKQFIRIGAIAVSSLLIESGPIMAQKQQIPESYRFDDDGVIPNSMYPLLLYHRAFPQRGQEGGDWLEALFAANGWTNSWRWGIYPFHHYHSNTHEVLGVFSGSALLHLGGEQGRKLSVQAGDIVVIPAGVGHKCLDHTDNFTVLGAYPDGRSPDLHKGLEGERPQADRNIAAVPLPRTDPFMGMSGGLRTEWIK